MKRVCQLVRTVATKDVTMTFIGESGVGKEVLARWAHQLSVRRHGPFIPVNCTAIPEGLFESELFGHERGAFTGASHQTKGKVEAADRGTLFLDEIGEMPLPMQVKLLRFLENLRFMRVGGSTKHQANIRLMCATLRPLEEDVRTGRFRADLFYRIQGITVGVPPLRDRRADTLPLLRRFVEQITVRHQLQSPHLGRRIKQILMTYDWPGNVRELRNIVEMLCLLREGRKVREEDLPASIRSSRPTATTRKSSPTRASLTLDLNSGLDALIRQIVEAALAVDGGNKSRAAQRLKISLRTIQRYIASGRVRSMH